VPLALPRATYRIQLGPDFGFDAAGGVADYLCALGVSHLYLSPPFQAAPGSTHGYDIVDATRVSRERGGEDAFRRMTAALGTHGLGMVVDVVPNHMAAAPENRLWWDVLKNGESSRFSHFFDVDWAPPEPKLKSTVLLPVLEDHYGRVLESGLIRLDRCGGAFHVRYRDHHFPVAPRALPLLVGPAAERCGSRALSELSDALAALPEAPAADADGRAARDQLLRALEARLQEALSDPWTAECTDGVVQATEANPDALDELLELQCYRLAYWRAGAHELDYRRFFDIDSLVALRPEHEDVFLHSHALVLGWLRDGTADGVRVDHPDGLREPRLYLEQLRAAAPDAWIVAEKILGPDEALPPSWPVHGTTGYDFLNEVGGLFVDASAEEPLSKLYADLTGERASWRELVLASKRRVLADVLASDVERLTHLFVGVCEGRRRFRDYTRRELRDALMETAAHLPVYRAYVEERGPAGPLDRAVVESAVAGALHSRPDIDTELMAFLRRILLGEDEGGGPRESRLRLRFQQLTGAVTAKAVEDTAFYAWPRLAALNEVGGEPDRFGLTPAEFHARAAARQALRPHGMLALSTHDTKRSEDVRARLFLLTEVPERWEEAVRGWMSDGERRREGAPHPDRSMEYLLYQTLVGAHPLTPERARAYMEKASREAKVHTSWTDPDPEYDHALARFVEGLLADRAFREELEGFVQPLLDAGWVNALAQKLVQLTSPGVPDLYQGSELWDLSLVDPDNRRPVDFRTRMRLLDELGRGPGGEYAASSGAGCGGRIWGRRAEGLPKLWVVRQALALRLERPELFGAEGGYQPVVAEGPAADHAFAFARGGGAITVVPRLRVRLAAAGGWGDTVLRLPEGRWTDRLSGRSWSGGPVPIEGLLGEFPVALLSRDG